MTRYKKGYKVVQKRTLNSCNVIDGAIKYRVNKWVVPLIHCGPLCIFKNIEDAGKFNHFMLDTIYECLYEESKGNVVYIKDGRSYNIDHLPRGTVLATKVKLVKRVR